MGGKQILLGLGLQAIPGIANPVHALGSVLNVQAEMVSEFVESRPELRNPNLQNIRQPDPFASRGDQECQDSAALGFAGVVPHF